MMKSTAAVSNAFMALDTAAFLLNENHQQCWWFRLLTNLICKSKVGNLHKHKAPSGRELARVARLRENAVL